MRIMYYITKQENPPFEYKSKSEKGGIRMLDGRSDIENGFCPFNLRTNT